MSSSPEQCAAVAHLRLGTDGQVEKHPLEHHLRKVACRAGTYAGAFGMTDWAWLAGLWHDLGKYRPGFQKYICDANGLPYADRHLEEAQGFGEHKEHSTAGAIYAVKQLKTRYGKAGEAYGRVFAYLIAGHHAGLADWQSADAGATALCQRLEKKHHLADVPLPNVPVFIKTPEFLNTPTAPLPTPAPSMDAALWVRMLFSCLVDADFLDTESFMSPAQSKRRGQYPDLATLNQTFQQHIDPNRQVRAGETLVNTHRREVLAACETAAELAPGLFSLTVPTGGGKTLSSMAFALKHALKHSKQRIIYVIPFTSIIEQTADVFRTAFGEFKEAVLEHHSNFDPDEKDETSASKMAAENWDSPIVVTTAVQFFESLFAAKTKRVRKLHNLVNSVVILDEAQTLPVEFLKPCLVAIQQLADHYGCTLVLCTATQPTLQEKPVGDVSFPALKNMREIIPNRESLYDSLKRVTVLIRNKDVPVTWPLLGEELAQRPQVLCIVDRRADALELFRLVNEQQPEGSFHLSSRMCGAHRTQVLTTIRARLKDGLTARVVSTQLIEAGVDVDFPAVYRCQGGLDAIAQAAGRCNREGKQPGMGEVIVFRSPKDPPPGFLRQAQDSAKHFYDQQDTLALEYIRGYFAQLYWGQGGNLDKHDILGDLKVRALMEIKFRTAAENFRLVQDTQKPVIVIWGVAGQALIRLIKAKGPEGWLMRKAQRYTVNVPIKAHAQLAANSDIREIHPGVFVQTNDLLYDPETGLQYGDDTLFNPDGLIL